MTWYEEKYEWGFKTLPEGTTKAQWDQWLLDISTFERRMDARKPKRINFELVGDYDRACLNWEIAKSCDAPNEPGYYRANND